MFSKLNDISRYGCSGGSRISPRWGRQLPGEEGRGHHHMILPKISKNCMTLKEFGPPGGDASKILLCRSATGFYRAKSSRPNKMSLKEEFSGIPTNEPRMLVTPPMAASVPMGYSPWLSLSPVLEKDLSLLSQIPKTLPRVSKNAKPT